MTEQDETKPTFWKRAAKILKKPFVRKPVSPVESSESESDYSEEEYSLDSGSESDSDASTEKHQVAALSSQAHLNRSDVNNRYALRRQPKPSLKAIEAREAEILEKQRKKAKTSTVQRPAIVPSAPLLYPNLSPSPTPQLVTCDQITNRNKYQIEHRPVDNNISPDIFKVPSADKHGTEILKKLGPYNIQGENGLPLSGTQPVTLEDLVTELHVKYNYSLHDASRLAQDILDKRFNHNTHQGGNTATNFSLPYNSGHVNQHHRAPPTQTSYPTPTNTNPFTTPQQTTENFLVTPAFFTIQPRENPVVPPRPENTIKFTPTIPPRTPTATCPKPILVTDPPPTIPARTPTPNIIKPSRTASKPTIFLTPQQIVEKYLANTYIEATPLLETHSTPFTSQKSTSETNPFLSTDFRTPLILGSEQSEGDPVNTPFLFRVPTEQLHNVDKATDSTWNTRNNLREPTIAYGQSSQIPKEPVASQTGSIPSNQINNPQIVPASKHPKVHFHPKQFLEREGTTGSEVSHNAVYNATNAGFRHQFTAQEPSTQLRTHQQHWGGVQSESALQQHRPAQPSKPVPVEGIQPQTMENPPSNQMTQATIADLVKVFGSQQENQAISLLQNVSPFSGTPSLKGISSPRFETWIRTFEAVIDMANFDETRKVKLLSSKLTSVAAESLDDFMRSRTNDRITYALVKKHLMNRFHGAETREMYEKEFRSCIKQTAETVLDYAHRLRKLFQHVYPLTNCQRGIPDVINMQDTMLKDKFLSGLPVKLREKVKFKTFASFDDLIKATTKYEVAIHELDEERRQIDIVAQITSHSQDTNRQCDTQLSQFMKEMNDHHKELVAEIKETQKAFAQQWRNDFKEKKEDTQRKPSTTTRNDAQRPQLPYNTNYPPQPPQNFQQNPGYAPQMQPYPPQAPVFTPTNFYPPHIPTYPAHQQIRTMPPPTAPPLQNPMECKRCGRMGHYARICRAPAPIGTGNFQCYNCREEGHIARNCPLPRNNPAPQGN